MCGSDHTAQLFGQLCPSIVVVHDGFGEGTEFAIMREVEAGGWFYGGAVSKGAMGG